MKRLRSQIVSGVLVLSMLATMLPMSAFAAEGGESPVDAEPPVLEESLRQDSTKDKIQSKGETGTVQPHVLSETKVEYAVEGGNIYFDTVTGKITGCDRYVTSADIPSKINGISVTSIGDYAFRYCYDLNNVTIPDGVTFIGNFAFAQCFNLNNVTIPDSVTFIGNFAFANCEDLTSVTIPDGVTSIGDSTFFGCYNLTSVTIPDSVTFIGEEAFTGCKRLASVTIGGGVTSIGERAFSSCNSLTSVTIPDSVISIGVKAFFACSNLNTINVNTGNSAYYSIDGVLFLTDGHILHTCPGGRSGEYTIPDDVTSIGDWAFSGCGSLTGVTIPDSVTSIGERAFSGCDSLTSMTIPDSVTSIGDYAFDDCFSLTRVTIGDGVTSIGESAFSNCIRLTSATIPDSVTTIGDWAFSACFGLTSVTIGGGVTDIGGYAFSNCSSLTNVYYGGSEENWDEISIGYSNEELTGATIHYNSTGPDDPGTEQPEASIGSVEFFSKWDSNTKQAYFDYSVLAYSVTDNTEISPNQSIDQLVGKYVLVKMNESSPLEISSIKPVDSRIGTVTDVIVGNDNPAVTSLQFEDGTYAVVNGLIVSEGIIGKQVLYHLSSEEIVGYTELQKKTGTLEKWDSNSGQLVINGVTYFTNYIADENLFTIADQLVGKRVEVLCLEGATASYIFQIAEAKEDYHIQMYASTPNLSTNINGTIDIICSLYRDDKLVEDWVEPAFVIGNDKIISTSDYTLKDGSYYFTVTGLAEGRSSLTVSDSYSGAYITVDISVGKATSRISRSG